MQKADQNELFSKIVNQYLEPCKYRNAVFIGANEGSRMMYRFLRRNDFFLKFGFFFCDDKRKYSTELVASYQVHLLNSRKYYSQI